MWDASHTIPNYWLLVTNELLNVKLLFPMTVSKWTGSALTSSEMCLQPPCSCGRNGLWLQWTHFTWQQSTGRLAHMSTHISLPISLSSFLKYFLFKEKIKGYSKQWIFIRTFQVQWNPDSLLIQCLCCWLKLIDSILLVFHHSPSYFTL